MEEEKTFYMLYAEEGRTPTYKHLTFKEAGKEAERLARQFNTKIYILKALNSVEVEYKYNYKDLERNCLLIKQDPENLLEEKPLF